MKTLTKSQITSIVEKTTWKPSKYETLRAGTMRGEHILDSFWVEVQIDYQINTGDSGVKISIQKWDKESLRYGDTKVLGFYANEIKEHQKSNQKSIFNAIDQKTADSKESLEFLALI